MKISLKLKLGFMVFLMALFTIQLSAQRPEGGQRPGGGTGGGPGGQGRGFQMSEEDIMERVDKLSATLELTEAQHKKILDYELESYTKMQVEREKNMGDREAMRATMMAAREARDKKYEELLTAEQLKKYRELEEQRREERRQQGPSQGTQDGGDRPERGRGRN